MHSSRSRRLLPRLLTLGCGAAAYLGFHAVFPAWTSLLDDGPLPSPHSAALMADLGDLSANVDLESYRHGEGGSDSFSVDIATVLPGGLVALPGDVVEWDGASYTLAFDAVEARLRASLAPDAATRAGDLWLLSFDTVESVAGATAEDSTAWSGASRSQRFPASASASPGAASMPLQAARGLTGLGIAAAVALGLLGLTLAARVRERALRRGHAPEGAASAGASLVLTLGVLAAPSVALAVDGVLEINQACAVNTGCFAGDGAGFPVTISGAAGRSVRLTSDLNVPPSTTGISISAPGVTVDLNGFALIGPETCTGGPGEVECTSSGDFDGIFGPVRTVVRNGHVEGFSRYGINIEGGRIEGVVVTGNRSGGISVLPIVGFPVATSGAVVSRCNVSGNEGVGIGLSRGTLSDSVVFGNGAEGIVLWNGGTVRDSESNDNGGYGVLATSNEGVAVVDSRFEGNGQGGIYLVTSNGQIRGNTVGYNSGAGIESGSGSVIDSNVVIYNEGRGISVGSVSLVLNNVVRSIGSAALYFRGSQSQYRGNTIGSNVTIEVNPGSNVVNRGSNLCNGSVVCP